MAKIIKKERRFGYWKCEHCDSEVSGKYVKCLACGAPVPKPKRGQKSVYFLKPNTPPITQATEAALQHKGPDWICDHCAASNSDMLGFCDSCGNKRDEADYTRETVRYGRGVHVPGSHDETFAQAPPIPSRNKVNKKKLFIILGSAAAVLAVVAYFLFFKISNVPVKVTEFSWDRTIQVEELKTFTEGDWSVPAGGRVQSRSLKFSHNEQVLDHYESQMVTKTRDVYDGEETWTETVDNGDGTFTTETRSRSKYRQESYSEQEQVPVYRDEPVYRDWYTYDIDRWVENRLRNSNGNDQKPYWAEYKLADKERLGYEKEVYKVKVVTTERKESKYYELEVPFAQWSSLQTGQSATLKIKGLNKIVGLE